MKDNYRMFIVLTAITILSGGLLAALDGVTAPIIQSHRLNELRAAISDVLPPHEFYEEISRDRIDLYVGRNKEGEEPIGIAFRVIGSGFQGKISIMVGVKPDFSELTGIKVLEQGETPGLGTKIVADPSNKTDPLWFPEQFKGLKIRPRITVVKNAKPSKPTEIQAISGATISSKAVVQILNEQIQDAKSAYRNESMPD